MKELFTLKAGETAAIQPVIMPDNATDKSVVYVSSDVTVATVDAAGVITAWKPGFAQITITAKGYTATCQVFVKPDKVKGVKKKTVMADKITLSWKKVKGVTGYQIYKYDKKSRKYKLCKTVKGETVTISKLAKGTSYKFKIRAYKKDKVSTFYGNYSKALRVKTKK